MFLAPHELWLDDWGAWQLQQAMKLSHTLFLDIHSLCCRR